MTTVLTSRQKRSLKKRIDAAKVALAAQRDEIRDILWALEGISDTADDALDCLDRAADALSQYL